MSELSNLKPKELFGYFEKICSIPHGSGKTDQIVDYLVQFAKERSLDCYRDETNNVIIRKPASKGYENSDTIVLQGHHDMVCEKVENSNFDFDKDGIETYVDGDWLKAKETTLGGDNGIAVAMILAILDNDSLEHPPIEALITADEEIGMVGAFAFDTSKLNGHKLINLDSEYEGIIMCGCAGGANARSKLKVNRIDYKGEILEIVLNGFLGGHSGVEIDKGRANSNVIMARLLHDLADINEYYLLSLEGGARESAIANLTTAQIAVDSSKTKDTSSTIKTLMEKYKKEYATADPKMSVTVTSLGAKSVNVLDDKSTELVHTLLIALPDGVQTMSMDMEGLVQTSTNFGLLKLEEDCLTFTNTMRSSITSQKEWIIEEISAIVKMAGGEAKVDGNYPGWAYNPNSELKDVIVSAYKNMTGKEMTVEAVHAGIECGLFADSIDNLDCVSIGPQMADVHTPNEHLSISSSARTYELLIKVLADSK